MSVPAEEMLRRRVPVAPPAVQQLALPAPAAPAPAAPLGTPPVTTVPPAGIPPGQVVTQGGGMPGSISTPRAAAAPAAPALAQPPKPAVINVNPAGVARPQYAPQAGGRLPPGVTGNFGPTPVVNPALSPNTAATGAGATPGVSAADVLRTPQAGSTAYNVGRVMGEGAKTAGTVARFGASPVQSVPGRLSGIGIDKTAPGQRGGTGAFLATTGIMSALNSLGTPTEDYAMRTGITGTGAGAELANRTLGTLSDFGAALVDTGAWAGNKLGQITKAVWPGAPEALTRQTPYLRDQFADVQAGSLMQNYQQPSAGSVAAAPPLPAGQQTPAAAAPTTPTNGVTPAANDGPLAPGERGAEITRADGSRRTVRGAEIDALANRNVIPAFQGGAAQQLGAAPAARASGGPVGAVIGGNDRGTIERIDKAIADIGPMDRRGRRQAVVDLLGLRNRVESGDADRASVEQRSAADVAQRTAASELAAEVDREQIAASAANQRRQTTQTITDASGNTYAMNDGALTQLTTPDGQPFKAATKTDNSQFDLAAKLLADSGGMMTPNQAADYARQLQQAVQGGGSPQVGAVVDGFRFKGGDPAQQSNWEKVK